MVTSRRAFLGGTVALGGLGSSKLRAGWHALGFTPEMFGAKGDGATNDSSAFAALSHAVNAAGGGTIRLRPTTYLVGKQTGSGSRGAGVAFKPAQLLEFVGCPGPITVLGNGARIKCVAGLRYGTFDPVTGAPTEHAMPFNDSDEVASPYTYMILFDGCGGAVRVEDLELDGSIEAAVIGGTFGDTGRQIAAVGLGLFNGSGTEVVSNVHSHHHGLDGIKINGISDTRAALPLRLLQNVRSEYNGRQGCSIVGGKAYVFKSCSFNHTGRAGVSSKPGGGVDIEAEGTKQVRDLRFVDCEFINNVGPGVVADQGDGSGASFGNCRFVGTTGWSVWPKKPGFVFRYCSFAGSLVNCYGSEDRMAATRFYDCLFTDDTRLSPTHALYFGKNPSKPIADLAHSTNTLFSRCHFQLNGEAVLPWSLSVIYEDCTMIQRSSARAFPRGTFKGTNRIVGNVDIGRSQVSGTLVINGTPVRR